jgi:hypothetical protein
VGTGDGLCPEPDSSDSSPLPLIASGPVRLKSLRVPIASHAVKLRLTGAVDEAASHRVDQQRAVVTVTLKKLSL